MNHNQMLETFKSSFLFNFRTGNLLLDTIIGGFIIMCAPWVLSMASQFKQWLAALVLDVWSYFINAQDTAKINISGRKIEGTQGSRLEFSTTFLAVLHQIKQLNCKEAGIHEMDEIAAAGRMISRNGCGKMLTNNNLIVSQQKEFSLTSKITGKVRIKNNTAKGAGDEQNKEGMSCSIEVKIAIVSKKLSMDELRETVDTWIEEYQEFQGTDKSLKYFHYSPVKMDKRYQNMFDPYGNDSDNNSYTELRFESGKSFENVFFPEKLEMMTNLDYFSNNKEWYKKKGIPYTMGFLLHGEPGCGKTSTIKAIANYTGRHIISVPLNKLKTYNELLGIFYNTSINHKIIPLKKRLYVLEDIDCSKLKDIVEERNEKEETKVQNNEEETDNDMLNKLATALNLKVSPTDAFDKKTELTLSALLEILDGVMEMDGRMMVITTNYPDKLDKALIRPGRIDMNIKFSKCSSETLSQMYQHFYDSHLEEGIILPEDKWTPAEATQMFLKNLRNPSRCLDQLLAR